MANTQGAFTDYAARLVQPGAVEYDDDDKPARVTDVYAVTLPIGVRPILSAISGLPAAGSQHSAYPYLVRGGITIRNAVEQAGSRVWYVDVAFSPASSSATVDNPNDDPEGQPVPSVVRIVERAWPVYETQCDLVADCDTGDPVLNAAGEPYDRVPTITRRYIGARVKRLEQHFPKAAQLLDGTLNTSPIYVLGVLFPSRCARLEVEIEDSLAVGSETRYAVTYNIVPAHNVYGKAGSPPADLDAGWDVPLLEAGFSYLSSGDLVRATVEDAEGNVTPTPLPVPLTAAGALLPSGSDPVVRVWHTYPDADWSDLNLPETPTQYDPPEPTPPEP